MSVSDGRATETAEQASEEALKLVFAALDKRHDFKLEAGAGAGKTYSLIQALRRMLEERSVYLPRSDQRIACLTYTKVARDAIVTRTDKSPFVFADTLHGFLWEMISPYQKALSDSLLNSTTWEGILAEHDSIEGRTIEYDLGIRGINEQRIALHHDDIPALAIELFSKPKFRSLIADKFPVILIDEYQDTPAGLAEAMLSGHSTDQATPVFGFFGDHWQQIYDRTCGSLEHEAVNEIPKNANFRSDRSIVNFLNCLRPELPQAPAAGVSEGSVTIYHTNEWPGTRLTHHWKGQISHDATRACLSWMRTGATNTEWIQNSNDLKILMLTHAMIANELGYATLSAVFKYKDAFIRKEDPVIEYLIDTVEPALMAFNARRYGELFEVLGGHRPTLSAPSDKVRWSNLFRDLDKITENEAIGDVLDCLRRHALFAIPTRVDKRDQQLKDALGSFAPDADLTEPRELVEHQKLRRVKYAEVRALSGYLANNTVYSTQHGVKGAEFDDVAVLVGRGWSRYDFAKMLSTYPTRDILDAKDRESFERSRNLFYVAASRAKHNLVLLFVQELSDAALATLKEWVGAENVLSVAFDDDLSPKASPLGDATFGS